VNITVLGAAGGTGRLVVIQGLRRAHQITAFTRRPHALPATPTSTRVVTGDGRDPDAVRDAVTGTDAVIAIISAPGRRGPHHIAAVAGVLTSVMAETGVRRLAMTTAYPIVAERPRIPLTLLRWAYADAAQMEQIVSATDLDWRIVRPNRLTDKPASGRVQISRGPLDRPGAMTRADAATTLLDTVEGPA
jgi:putative NADH-flavin reductase